MAGIIGWVQGESGKLLVAGLAGPAVSAAMEWTGILPAVRKIIVGSCCAMYLSPLAVPMLSWALGGLQVPQENAATLGGFLMGVVGIIIIEIIVKAFRMRLVNPTAPPSPHAPLPPAPIDGE